MSFEIDCFCNLDFIYAEQCRSVKIKRIPDRFIKAYIDKWVSAIAKKIIAELLCDVHYQLDWLNGRGAGALWGIGQNLRGCG
jgi:hypothetical protein